MTFSSQVELNKTLQNDPFIVSRLLTDNSHPTWPTDLEEELNIEIT